MTRRQNVSDSELKRLLRVRRNEKRNFTRDQAWRFKRVKEKWRRPKGIHNKVRKEVKGRRPKVKIGYRSPKAVRGLHPSGKKERRIKTLEDMYNINPKTEVVRIAGTVGRRKRREIINFAHKYGIRVTNSGIGRAPEAVPRVEEELLLEEEELFKEEKETTEDKEEIEEELFKEEKETTEDKEEIEEENNKDSSMGNIND